MLLLAHAVANNFNRFFVIWQTYRIENDDSDNNSPSFARVKKLEKSLVWEIRSLYVVAISTPLWFVFRPAGIAGAGFGVLATIVMVSDTFFFDCPA